MPLELPRISRLLARWRLLLVVGLLGALPVLPAYAVSPAQAPTPVSPRVDTDAAARRLAGALRIKTISFDDQPAPAEVFAELRRYIEQNYPGLHRQLRQEEVNRSSLLYTWPGRDPQAKPILVMAHQDVVPVAPGSESQWTHPPFAGDIADGYIWGRGAWDNKGNLFAQLEAIELLVEQGVQPEQTIYLAFGHDEETGPSAGQQGARKIVELLKARGVHLASVLDEGLLITHGVMKGLDVPVAMIGIAEKGYVTLRLATEAHPGHSSMPPEKTAIGQLSLALANLQEHPYPLRLTAVVRNMLEVLAPHFTGLKCLALNNLWLFESMVLKLVAETPAGAAMLRTSMAMTTLNAGNKDNVLPARAEASINFRTLPGDRIEDVVAYVRRQTGERLASITVKEGAQEASPISRQDSVGYLRLRQSIEAVFPGVLVAPGLMIAATDSRHFQEIADDVYRFSPVHASPDDLNRFHGTNERISVANYGEMIRFYYRYLGTAPQPANDRALSP